MINYENIIKQSIDYLGIAKKEDISKILNYSFQDNGISVTFEYWDHKDNKFIISKPILNSLLNALMFEELRTN